MLAIHGIHDRDYHETALPLLSNAMMTEVLVIPS
jgi:hypothetical protein